MGLSTVIKTSHSAILLLSAFATSLLAQDKKRPDLSGLADAYEKRSFEDEDGQKLLYRLLKPPSLEKGKKYPVLVCLHGSGGRGKDNRKNLSGTRASQVIANPKMVKKFPCFAFVPQCPPEGSWSPRRGENQDYIPVALAVLDALMKEFEEAIDPGRIYVTGQSMGGAGTYNMLSSRPGFFAAGAPVCGGWKLEDAPKLARSPIWIFHGANDRIVPTKYSRELHVALKQARAVVKYTEYPGVGHNSWTKAYADPEFWDWMFSLKRSK
ncbi:MAG: phospholipase [Opitutales bacterium]|nr:phospholipase [Opitutales bacterium]